MATTMKDFLQTYFKQLHFNSMPDGVYKHFMDWVKSDTLTQDMKNWVKDYMTPVMDASGVITGYKKNADPTLDPTKGSTLSDEEARKLFIACQNVFIGMAGDIKNIRAKHPRFAFYIESLFGKNKLFDISPAKKECADGIAQVVDALDETKPNADKKTIQNIKEFLVENVKSDDKQVFSDTKAVDELLQKCKTGKYDSDHSVQTKITKIASTLKKSVASWSGVFESDDPEYNVITGLDDALTNITASDAFSQDPANINPDKIKQFREINGDDLLNNLYTNPDFREIFKKHDTDQKIIKPLNEAFEKVNWQNKDGPNYVDEKLSDNLRPWQAMQKWVGDTYNDSFKKFHELRGDPLFVRPEPKDIFKAVDKVGIKPIDGLQALLDKSGDIEKKIDNPNARNDFKWFVETMGPIARKMPEAVKGAWKDATQMNAVIDNIILKATAPGAPAGAVAAAATAMEIMNAMRYGMLTSKTMEAFKSQEFNLLSDTSYSWMKNDATKFIATALDKSAKAAFMTVGYSVTIVRNQIYKKYGSNLKARRNTAGNELQKRIDNEQASINREKQSLVATNKLAEKARNDKQQILDNLQNNDGITADNIVDKEKEQADYEQQKQNLESKHQDYVKNQAVLQDLTTLEAEIKNLEQQSSDTAKEVMALTQQYQKEIADPAMPQQLREQKQTELYLKQQELSEKQKQIQAQLQVKNAELRQQKKQAKTAKNEIQNLQADEDAYDDANKNYLDLKEKTERFHSASASIKEINEQIKANEEALRDYDDTHKAKAELLRQYWRDLQSSTKTFGLSTERAQKRFNKKIPDKFNLYFQNQLFDRAA